jgi:hypothetical protein
MTNFGQLKKISEKPWFYPVALLLIGFVTYKYALTSLGYYWADWEIVMFTKLNPTLQFNSMLMIVPSLDVSADLLSYWFKTDWLAHCDPAYSLGGDAGLVHFLILLWPRYKNHFLWMGVLLLMYPGFLQQSQSATKARHFMTFLLFALSIYLMALAIKRPKWARWLFPLSWLATFTHLFTTEYFAGFELMRPLLIWMLIGGEDKRCCAGCRYSCLMCWSPRFIFGRVCSLPVVFETMSRSRAVQCWAIPGNLAGPCWFVERALFDLIY